MRTNSFEYVAMALFIALVGLMVWSFFTPWHPPVPSPLSACYAIDGDTLDCADERIRLLGIDAPESHERDGQYATDVLRALTFGPLRIDREGKDRYGRTLAHVYGTDENVACTLLTAHAAAYVERWDNLPQGRVARECGL